MEAGCDLDVLAEGSEVLSLAALEVLRPLARDPSMKDLLREAGAFKPLVGLLTAAAQPSRSASARALPRSGAPRARPEY